LSDLSRRDFSKTALAALGGAGIALLLGGSSAGLSGETDSKAVLFSPPAFDPNQRVISPGGNTGNQAWVSPLNKTGWIVADPIEDPVLEAKVQIALASFAAISFDVIPDGSTVPSTISYGFTPTRIGIIYDAVGDKLFIGDDGTAPSGGIPMTGGVAIRGLKNLSNNIQRINDDETQSTRTIGTIVAFIKSFVLAPNSHLAIELEGDGYIQTGLTSVQQDVNIQVRYAGVQIGQLQKFNPESLTVAGAKIPFSIKRSAALQAGGTVGIAVNGAAIDANTTVFLNRMAIYGILA